MSTESNTLGNAPNITASSDAEELAGGGDVVYMGHLKFSVIFAALCLSVFQVALVRWTSRQPRRKKH